MCWTPGRVFLTLCVLLILDGKNFLFSVIILFLSISKPYNRCLCFLEILDSALVALPSFEFSLCRFTSYYILVLSFTLSFVYYTVVVTNDQNSAVVFWYSGKWMIHIQLYLAIQIIRAQSFRQILNTQIQRRSQPATGLYFLSFLNSEKERHKLRKGEAPVFISVP